MFLFPSDLALEADTLSRGRDRHFWVISSSYQPQRKEVTSFYGARCSHYIQDLLVRMLSG